MEIEDYLPEKGVNVFLNNLGNLARKVLLCRWESPKYCSTIYRILEMVLLCLISCCVHCVPRTVLSPDIISEPLAEMLWINYVPEQSILHH